MAIVGNGGALKIATVTVADIKNWKLDINIDLKDSTSFGDAWKEAISCIKSWSASADGSWVITTDTNGQTALQTAMLAGTVVALRLYVDATHYYGGNAYIKKLGTEAPHDDLLKVTFDFEGDGALTYN